MSNLDDTEDLKRWMEIMNMTYGYGGVFNYKTADDKAIVERSTAKEWGTSIAAEFSLMVGEPEHNPADPPDIYISVEGQRLAVELVQLIEPEHKQRAANGESPYAGQLFLDMQWSKKRLINRLNDIVQNKGRKYERNEVHIDVLVIHTAETWLNLIQAREWLADIEIKPHPNIATAFLLFEYQPISSVQHWPVYPLYGDLAGNM